MNKFNLILNQDNHEEHKKSVKEIISDYCEIDIDCLLKGTDAAVFGGAVRDSIADKTIHDVDILALSQSSKIIANELISNGYHQHNLISLDIATLYNGLKVIHTPLTYVKNNKVVQIIRPYIHIQQGDMFNGHCFSACNDKRF